MGASESGQPSAKRGINQLLGLPLESFDPLKDDIKKMHDRVVNWIYLAAVIIAPLIILANLSKFAETGREYIMGLLLVYMGPVAIYVFRNRISYNWRAMGILIVFFILGTASLCKRGPMGGGIPSMIVQCVLSTIFLNRRTGFWFLLASLTTIAVVGTLAVKGIITFDMDMNEDSKTFVTWLVVFISFAFYVGLTVLALGNLRERTVSFLGILRKRATEMEDAKIRLEQEISERKKIEQQFYQSQKMEAIGKLAGGVAHDFNNQLMVIMNLMERIKSSFDTDDERIRYAEMILESSQQSADLTRQLLAFSRKQMAKPEVFNLNAAIQKIATMIESITLENIELIINTDRSIGNIEMDRVHLEQAILNLVVNAKDSMPEGGKVTIETTDFAMDRQFAKDRLSIVPGQYMKLAITDTGKGMDEETMSHIFEPFFTTKHKDHGTGLGLPSVYGIIKQAGGHIYVDSEVNAGTCFNIYLPKVSDSEYESEVKAQYTDKITGNGETILVVEDEALVRETAVDMLTANGYKVIEAENGEAALPLFEKHKGSIDMILTDVIMTGMDGRKLTEKIKEISPNTKCLYISGYPANVIANRRVLEPEIQLLPKPFSTTTLLQKIRDILSSS